MNNVAFRKHIKAVSGTTLDAYFDEVTAKMARVRSPASRLGCAMALDDLTCEAEMRRTQPSSDTDAMSDDDLLADLLA